MIADHTTDKSQMISGLNNDLRSPMHVILTQVGLLQRALTGQHQQHRLQQIETAINAMVPLLTYAEDYAKHHQNSLEQESRSFYMHHTLELQLAHMASVFLSNGLDVFLDFSAYRGSAAQGSAFYFDRVIAIVLEQCADICKPPGMQIILNDQQCQLPGFITLDFKIFQASVSFDSFSARFPAAGEAQHVSLKLLYVCQVLKRMGGDIFLLPNDSHLIVRMALPMADATCQAPLSDSIQLGCEKVIIVDTLDARAHSLKSLLPMTDNNILIFSCDLLTKAIAAYSEGDIFLMDESVLLHNKDSGCLLSGGDCAPIILRNPFGHKQPDAIDRATALVIDKPLLPKQFCRQLQSRLLSTQRKAHRILVVEDSRLCQLGVGAALTALGYHFDVVNSGEQALQRIADHCYFIVLMDIGLPGLDGVGTAQCIRQKMQQQTPYVIALTGFTHTADLDLLMNNADFHHVLTKPTSIETLEQLLNQVEADALGCDVFDD